MSKEVPTEEHLRTLRAITEMKGDTIHVNTRMHFTWVDRVRILFGGRVEMYLKIDTLEEITHAPATVSHVWVPRLFRCCRRSLDVMSAPTAETNTL